MSEFQDDDLRPYMKPWVLNPDWVSIRDNHFPENSVNPHGSGRFHEVGKITYYAASGLDTARAELEIGEGEPIPDPYSVYYVAARECELLDLPSYIRDHPRHSDALSAPMDEGGWSAGIALRRAVEQIGGSGIVYNSCKKTDGYNAALWDTNNTTFEFFEG